VGLQQTFLCWAHAAFWHMRSAVWQYAARRHTPHAPSVTAGGAAPQNPHSSTLTGPAGRVLTLLPSDSVSS
jgi:hypothetical protein